MNKNKNILVDIHRKTVAMLLLLAQLHTSCSTSLDKSNFNTNVVESCAVDDYKPITCSKPKSKALSNYAATKVVHKEATYPKTNEAAAVHRIFEEKIHKEQSTFKKPTVTKLVVTTKEKHNIVFEQKEQLVAHVKESCPQGFSRTLALPVIISNDFIQNIKQPNNSSLDALMQIMSQHNPKQIIHVFTPEMVKSLPNYQKVVFVKDGVVYVGYVSLLGGGEKCFDYVGAALAVVVVVAVSAGVGAGLGAAVGGLICGTTGATVGAGIGAVVGYSFGAFAIHDILIHDWDSSKTQKEREEAAKRAEEAAKKAEANAELDKKMDNVGKYSNEVISKVNELVDRVEQIGYEKIMDVLATLENDKSSLYNCISELESYKYNSYTSDRYSSINYDIDRLRDKIRNIDTKIAEAKNRAQKQAREKFGKDMMDMDKSSYDTDVILNDMLHGIESTDFNNNKSSVSNATNEANSNITKLEYWERQPVMSFDSSDINNVRRELANKRLRQEKVSNVQGLVEFAGIRRDNAAEIKKLLSIKDPTELKDKLSSAIKGNALFKIKYWILNNNVDPNTKIDKDANSLLHKAVSDNKPEIARYLAIHGADISIKNKKNLSPLDVAIKNKNQAMIDVLQGR